MSNNALLPEPDTSEDGVYQIFCLCYAKAGARCIHDNFMTRDMHDGPMPLDYNVWIVRNAHRTVLVDTGFGHRASSERGRPIDFNPIEVLPRIGIDPDTIEDVIITHLHYDHAGNMDRFAKARFHVQDAEVSFATGRCMCEAHLRFPFDVEDVVTLVRHTYAQRVCFHEGDDELLPGISLHALPGHSASVQAVRVVTRRGPVLLASDASHYYANFLRFAPFVLTLDAPATLRSYRNMLKIGGSVDRIIPGHDPKVRRLYPSCSVGGIELSELHKEPKPHSVEDLIRFDY
jgi:glyoxylase-like metal-dependent hydrolase (beta-lactamase superfamily II)